MIVLASAAPPGDAGDFRTVNDFARSTPWLHSAMTAYAGYGVALFALLLVAGWWLARRSGSAAQMAAVVWAGLGALAAVGANQPLGHWVAEPRPYTALAHVELLVQRSGDFSFVSDHAAMAGAVATGLLYVERRLGVFTWFAALVLAFARVYVGAHYPHDVVAGLALGAAVVVVGRTVAQPLLRWIIGRLTATPLRPVLTGDVREDRQRDAAPAG